MIPHCRLAFWRISWFIYLRCEGQVLYVERPIRVSCNPGQAALLDYLDHCPVCTAVADSLAIKVVDLFHSDTSFHVFCDWVYQNDTKYARIYSNPEYTY